MGLLNPSHDINRPTLKGVEVEGVVVDVDDPEKRQRVRVRIPVIHRDIPDDKLPWSNQRGMNQANAGAGVGSVQVPDKFAKVSVRFLSDDPHDPQYGPSPTSDDVNKDNELLQEDYPNTAGHADSFGNRWSTNKATGDVTFVHKSGASTTYDGAGNIAHCAAGDLTLTAKGKIIIASDGELVISTKAGLKVAGAPIDLNIGSATDVAAITPRTTPVIPDQSGNTSL